MKRIPGVTNDEYRAMVLALPHTCEMQHMGHPDFRVGKKIFATLRPDERKACFRVPLERLGELVASDPLIYRAVWGGRYLEVDLRRVNAAALRAIAAEAWKHTAPKMTQRAGGAAGRGVARARPRRSSR